MRINWYEPKVDSDEDITAVADVLKRNYVNEGPKTKEFEDELRKYLEVKHVILTANATAGLALAAQADAAIQGKKDFEVIVPDLTMIASATSINWAGGKPVIVDVEKISGTITTDYDVLNDKITERTAAIMPVHILGRAANMDRLEKIAKENGLTIIEDAAGALGSKDSRGRYLGTRGKVGVYSLQSNKIITTGQGGIIVTNDDEYFEKIRRLRDFGRMSNKEFLHEDVGYNLKFNDLSAALGLAQFKKLGDRKELLLKQRELYESRLGEVVGFFPYTNGEIPLWVDVMVENRAGLVEYLKKNDIYTRDCWPALHMNPAYRNHETDKDFPIATNISNNSLWLPNGPAINEEHINLVCSKIREFYNGS